LIKMREREGKHLAKDLIHRLKIVRQSLKEVRKMHPAVAAKYRETLRERISAARSLAVVKQRSPLVAEAVKAADDDGRSSLQPNNPASAAVEAASLRNSRRSV